MQFVEQFNNQLVKYFLFPQKLYHHFLEEKKISLQSATATQPNNLSLSRLETAALYHRIDWVKVCGQKIKLDYVSF